MFHGPETRQRTTRAVGGTCQQHEYQAELAEQAALRPRRPGNRRRMITLIVIAIVFILATLLSLLTLLPSATSSSGGVSKHSAIALNYSD